MDSRLAALVGFVVGCGLSFLLRADVPTDGLTDRQREMLAAVGGGYTTKEIAARTGVAESTVRTHIRRARETLGAPNRAAAIAALARASGRDLAQKRA